MSSGGRISRRIKQGKVEIDFEDSALLVNYELEMVQSDDNGMVMGVLERKPEVRRIKIKTLSADKNMAQLAGDIVDKCKYIHPSRVEEIEQLLIKLRKVSLANENTNNTSNARDKERMDDSSAAASTDRERDRDSRDRERGDRGERGDGERKRASEGPSGGGGASRGGIAAPSGRGRGRDDEDRPSPKPVDPLPPAYLTSLDDYLEMLYQVSGKSEKEREEGLKLQERGTGMILKLCRDVMNLEQLIQNGTVMGALTRVLQEEFKKSVELSFNILRIFLAFSNFAEMHSLMSQYKIGALTMKAIDFELKRAEVRESERADREVELQTELEAAKQDMATYPQVLDQVRRKREKEASKHTLTVRKQDKLLFVAFYILLNLAEDLSVERKMIIKSLIPALLSTLNRRFDDLLILCVTFLKKLCVIGENKDTVKRLNVVDTLVKFVPCSSQPLVMISLRLLFNLSFDKDMREQMLKGGMVPKLVTLLKTPSFRPKTLKLLYHLSVDDRCKSMVTYTDAIPILMGLVINFPQDYLPKELAALVVNVSLNPRNCELMLNNKGLNLLMDRLADKRDPLLVKIVRNLSMWTFNQQEELESPELQYKYRGLWSPHIKVLMEIIREEDKHDLLIEVFGTLANMTIYDLPASSNWSKLLRDYSLLALFCKLLVPGMAQNDLLLEIVMIISTVASDLQACSLIASSTLIGQLYQLWEEKGDDTELLLQLIHCFHKLFMHDASREEAMYSTRIVVDIIECLHHRNAAVRAKAATMCELVLEFDRGADGELGNLGKKILQKKFEAHNKAWLGAVREEYASHGYNSSMIGASMGGDERFYHDRTESTEWGASPLQHQGSDRALYHGHSDHYAGNPSNAYNGGSVSGQYDSTQAGSYDYNGGEEWRGNYK